LGRWLPMPRGRGLRGCPPCGTGIATPEPMRCQTAATCAWSSRLGEATRIAGPACRRTRSMQPRGCVRGGRKASGSRSVWIKKVSPGVSRQPGLRDNPPSPAAGAHSTGGETGRTSLRALRMYGQPGRPATFPLALAPSDRIAAPCPARPYAWASRRHRSPVADGGRFVARVGGRRVRDPCRWVRSGV
jgi:hypothetical protein